MYTERETDRQNSGPSSLRAKNKNFQCTYVTQALLLIFGNVLNGKLQTKEQPDDNNPNKGRKTQESLGWHAQTICSSCYK